MASTTARLAPDRWASWSIRLALIALIVFLPDGFSRWFLPKEVVLLGAVLLACLATPVGRLPRFLWWLVAAGSALLVLAALLGDAPLAQLVGRWPRYEGLVSLPVYVAAAWLGARTLGASAPVDRLRTFYRTLSVVALLLAAVSVAEVFGARPIASDLDRPGSLVGNATDQGLVGAAIVALLVLPLVRALEGRGRAELRATASQWGLLAAGLVAALVTVVISASRAGTLTLGAALLLLAVVYLVDAGRRLARPALVRRIVAVLVAGAAVVGALLALPFTRNRLLGVSDFAASSVGDRFVIWTETVDLLRASALTGAGPSGFLDAIAPLHGSDWYARVSTGTVLDSPHSWPLQAAVAGGLPLLALALVFCGYLVLRVWRGRTIVLATATATATGTAAATAPAPATAPRRADARRDLVVGSFAALVGLAVGLTTHFTGATTGILIGLLVGIVVAVAPRDDNRVWRRARTALVCVWLLLLVLATAAEIPLQNGLTATDAQQADDAFAQAGGLRPWDADLASIAAQSLAARADSGDTAAAGFAIAWAERALATIPTNVPTRLALAVAQRAAGEFDDSAETLAALASDIPLDPTIAFQHAISLASAGDRDAARSEIERALELRPDDPNFLAARDAIG